MGVLEYYINLYNIRPNYIDIWNSKLIVTICTQLE
jgi:hypothetical protein